MDARRGSIMKYKGLVFDFFGVICTEIAPFWLAERFPPEEARKIKTEIVGDADRGVISQREMFIKLASLSGGMAERIESEWLSLAHVNRELVDKIVKLKGVVRLGLLTNAPSPLARHLLNANGLSELFDLIVVSSEVKCAKPDRRIYEIILGGLALAPSDALMVDDNPENIIGANEVGMAGVVFTSNEQLYKELV
jgi:HAD superfamily hydrolase (TIGR01509 family)